MGYDKSNQDGLERNGSQHGDFYMEHDRRWRIRSGCLGAEWISIWQYTMECDRHKLIILGLIGNEWIVMWRFFYEKWWKTIAFFNANYELFWFSVGSVGNRLPHAWRGRERTGIFTGRCSCTVICWSCVWSKNVTSLNSSQIRSCF